VFIIRNLPPMLGLLLVTLACLAAVLLLLYTETFWSRFCVLLLVVAIALAWVPDEQYGSLMFILACALTAYGSFRMKAVRTDQIFLSACCVLVGLSIVARVAELPVAGIFLYIMWVPAIACTAQFIRQLRYPGDQTGILLILALESWFQAVQVFNA
jgi:hypothetical protein